MGARWQEIVGEYSGLDLSFGKDKFPAIFRVAKQMGTVQQGKLGRYLVRLRENNLDINFFWIPTCKLRRRPKQWHAPTWSWPSIEWPVTWGIAHNRVEAIAANISNSLARRASLLVQIHMEN
jgi:hypothetical protein